MNSVTVQNFLKQSFLNYQKTHRLPLYQIKAAEQLMKCRTASLVAIRFIAKTGI